MFTPAGPGHRLHKPPAGPGHRLHPKKDAGPQITRISLGPMWGAAPDLRITQSLEAWCTCGVGLGPCACALKLPSIGAGPMRLPMRQALAPRAAVYNAASLLPHKSSCGSSCGAVLGRVCCVLGWAVCGPEAGRGGGGIAVRGVCELFAQHYQPPIMHLVSTSLNLLGPSGVNHPLPYLDACSMLRLYATLCWLPMHWMLYWLWPIDP
jgi:hypothetical protein